MNMKEEIRTLADRYAAELKRSIDARVAEMDDDDRSHVLIYAVLGVSDNPFSAGSVIEGRFPRFRVDPGDEYARATSQNFRDRLPGGQGRFGDQVA